MTHSKLHPWFLIFFISLFNCSTEVPVNNPFDPNSPAGIQASGALRGKVSFETGESLERLGLNIDGIRLDLSGPSNLSARAESDGSFSFSNLPGGSYTVTATFTEQPQLQYEEAVSLPYELLPGQIIDIEPLMLNRPPLPPTLTEVEQDAPNSLTLRWSKADDPVHSSRDTLQEFVVYYRTHYQGNYSVLPSSTIPWDQTSFTITSSDFPQFNTATAYYFKVAAKDTTRLESALSEESRHQFLYPHYVRHIDLEVGDDQNLKEFIPETIQFTPSGDHILTLGQPINENLTALLTIHDFLGNRQGCVDVVPTDLVRNRIQPYSLTIEGKTDETASLWITWTASTPPAAGITKIPIGKLLEVSSDSCIPIETESLEAKFDSSDGEAGVPTTLSIQTDSEGTTTALYASHSKDIFEVNPTTAALTNLFTIESADSIKSLHATSEKLAVLFDVGLYIYSLEAPHDLENIVPVGTNPTSIHHAPKNDFLLVPNKTSSNISVIDIDSFTERARVTVAGAPEHLAVHSFSYPTESAPHTGDLIFVPNPASGELRIISATTDPRMVQPLNCTEQCVINTGSYSRKVAVSLTGERIATTGAEGRRLYLNSYAEGDL